MMFRKKRNTNQTLTINRNPQPSHDEIVSVYERIAHAHDIEDIEAAARRRLNNH